MSYTIDEHDQVCVLMIKGRFIGSIDGVGVLVRGAERLRAAGGDARLAGMQTRVKNLFVMTRLLGRMFDDYPTVEAALQSFAAPVASKQE